jgi:hypothetical protein
MLLCLGLLLLCLTATAGERRYERKCRKQAGKVEKAVQKCPSLADVRVDTITLTVPEYVHDTLIEIWGTDCEGCEFTHEITDTFYITKVVKDSSGLRVTNTRKARIDTLYVPDTTIVSANSDLSKALSKCQESHLDNAVLVGTCQDKIKAQKKRVRWLWVIIVGLSVLHVGRTKALRKLVGVPF